MLRVDNITKFYNKTPAISNVSFEIEEGQVAVLAGPNGAGKSTTIKSIAGLLKYEGSIEVCGYKNKSTEGKRRLGYIPEIPELFPLLTVYEHVEFMAHAYGVKDYKEEAERLLTMYELWDKKDKYGSELSKGMMQKVSICCCLITRPKVILIDEPMIGLDPKAIRLTKDLISQLKEGGASILISTHLLDSVQGLWDRVLIMKEGKIVYSRDRKDFAEGDTSLEDIFFEVTEE